MIGGSTQTPQTVERFDPRLGKSYFVTNTKEFRFGEAAAELGGKIYVVGGFGRLWNIMDTVEMFAFSLSLL